jgi:hypothetical protein
MSAALLRRTAFGSTCLFGGIIVIIELSLLETGRPRLEAA